MLSTAVPLHSQSISALYVCENCDREAQLYLSQPEEPKMWGICKSDCDMTRTDTMLSDLRKIIVLTSAFTVGPR